MTNFKQRILTGTLLVLLIQAAVWGGPYSFIALLLLIGLPALGEFYRLLAVARDQAGAGLLLSVCLILTCFAGSANLVNWKWMLINVPAAFGIFIASIYRPPVKAPYVGLAFTFLGVTMVSVPLCFFCAAVFLPLPAGHYHPQVAAGFFLLLWCHDTAAYLVGKRLGTHSLFLRLSPKKTWEGSAGGAAATLAAAVVVGRYFPELRIAEWLFVALIIIVAGTYGDLVKSLLKRSLGVKDSGTSLPGHGGMLDRFDSLLGSAPFLYCYLSLLWK